MAKSDAEGKGAKPTLSAAIHRVQLALLDDGPCTDRQLFAAGALLSRADYEDVLVERSIAGLCGYPTCPNSLPADRPRRGRYRISLSEHKVYDLEETYKFCSEACVVGSRAFSGSLQPERCVSAGPARIAEVLRLFEDLSLEERAGTGGGRPKAAAEDGDLGFSKLTIHEKSEAVAGEVSAEEWIGPSNAIEGYVPQRERNQGADAKRRIKTKPKSAKGSTDTDVKESEFTSTMIVGDPFNIVPTRQSSSVLASSGLEQGVQRLELGARVEKGESKEPPALKSSLKISGAKMRNHTVKWADEVKLEALEETEGSIEREVSKQRRESSVPLNEEDDDSSLRLESAEACVAALVQAAGSVASGESESGDAATEAGLVILPLPPCESEERDSEAEEDTFEFDKGFVKWPKKTVLLDTDMFEVEDSWHDTPPEGFILTLSPFATMWNALFGWITCSSLAFIYGRDEISEDDFLCVNGREFPHKIVLQDGRSSEIKQTMAGCIARALPQLVTDLHLQTPVSSIEKAMAHLLETMSFVDALPPFRTKQWRVIVLLFVDALSVHRIPAVTSQMTSSRLFLQKVLGAAQVSGEEYESIKDLILPLGRVPQFSVQSGG